MGGCPECAQGKHQNCTVYVLDADDNMIPCPCSKAGHPAPPTT